MREPVRSATEVRDDLVSRAVSRHRIPADVASRAARLTVRNLAPSGSVSTREMRRIEAYFWAVVRRSAARRDADAVLSGRYLIASVVSDLRSGGLSDGRILDELESCWADRVPQEVMDEFRSRLHTLPLVV